MMEEHPIQITHSQPVQTGLDGTSRVGHPAARIDFGDDKKFFPGDTQLLLAGCIGRDGGLPMEAFQKPAGHQAIHLHHLLSPLRHLRASHQTPWCISGRQAGAL